MADLKISQLTGASTPLAGTEVLPIVQSSTTKQVSVANLTAGRAVSAASLALTSSPLPATSGGTGSSSAFVANGIAYASSTTTMATSSELTFDGANLLFGTTTNTGPGKIVEQFAGGSQNGISMLDSTDTTGAAYLAFRTAAGVAVGTVTRGVGNTVLFNTTSDYRLKTVIGPVADAGQRIDALQPIEYTWNADGSRARGFLAHKFQEVYASSVAGSKDAVDAEGNPMYQCMQASTSEVVADLVAEIQSLRQRLAAAGI